MLPSAFFALSGVAVVLAQDPPQSMIDLCQGHIISWAEIPHDWNQADSSNWKGDGTASKRYVGKDWWYWKDDWKQKIANGDVDMEPRLEEEYAHSVTGGKPLIGRCGGGATLLRSMPAVKTVSECRLSCALEYSTKDVVREKCQFFSYEAATEQCMLYSTCAWPFDQSNNQISGDGLQERDCYGDEARSDSCSWGTSRVWKTYRIVDIYPAGFQSFSLREFNQPPLCIHVPQSSDKKVEVMVETEMNDSRICIMDGRDMGVYTNDVGNVRTCDNGKLYSCFTAATRRKDSDIKDFFFYISCEGSCEASDVDVWIRLRKSERSWDEGKKDWESDIEYWCENERGTTSGEKTKPNWKHQDFSYPSELLPFQPREYPYRITKGMNQSSAWGAPTALACSLGLLLAGYFLH